MHAELKKKKLGFWLTGEHVLKRLQAGKITSYIFLEFRLYFFHQYKIFRKIEQNK